MMGISNNCYLLTDRWNVRRSCLDAVCFVRLELDLNCSSFVFVYFPFLTVLPEGNCPAAVEDSTLLNSTH